MVNNLRMHHSPSPPPILAQLPAEVLIFCPASWPPHIWTVPSLVTDGFLNIDTKPQVKKLLPILSTKEEE